MKVFGVFVLICVAAFFLPAARADGPCEEIKIKSWIETVRTCYMMSIVIDSKDFMITSDRDETVGGFESYDNKNLEYLPNNFGAKFPNLLFLFAGYCSIKEVKKENFEGLSQLRYLWLHKNHIEKIEDDTFEHITAVEQIHLDNNKIKKLNGRAFASLHKLARLDLDRNDCINENFKTTERIAEMLGVVTEKCGFAVECNIEACLSEKSELEADLKIQLVEVSSLKSNNERLEIEKTQIESLHIESKAQLLLVSVAAVVTVAILLGMIVVLIKKRQTNNDSVAFRTSTVPE